MIVRKGVDYKQDGCWPARIRELARLNRGSEHRNFSEFKMPVSGPAGIMAFYILSTIGFPGLFYRTKSPFLMESTEFAKYMAIPLCSIAAFIIVKYMCQSFYMRSKPVLPAEQIVMDVKRMNINFTLLGRENEKPVRLSKLATSSKPAKSSTIGVSFDSLSQQNGSNE